METASFHIRGKTILQILAEANEWNIYRLLRFMNLIFGRMNRNDDKKLKLPAGGCGNELENDSKIFLFQYDNYYFV
jgi:hypothetical protein